MLGNRGITLVELLVVLVILFFVLFASYITYTSLLKGFKQETEIVSSQIETIIGLEMLRLDLEHIGYGIPANETAKIIEWDEVGKKLTIRTTLNNTNKETKGYLLLKCSSGNLNVELDSRKDPTNPYINILNVSDKNFFSKGKTNSLSSLSCTNGDIYIGFPIRKEVYDTTANGCNIGLCEEIIYELSTTNDVIRCNPNTKNLLRKTKNSLGEPVLNCVSDFRVRFDIDDNEDGEIGVLEENLVNLPISNTEIIKKLKRINVYILYQVGKEDKNYTFNNTVNCSASSGKCVEIDGIKLELPNNYEHYRWKPIKLSVKPMNL